MNYLAIERKKEDIKNLLILFGCFLFAQLLFSCFTSPLFPYNAGDDSAIFSLMGKGITEGKILYIDLFDHKGPLIFFIDALGHLLGGRLGIFFLQCCSGFCALSAMYFCGKQLRYSKRYTSFLECFFIFFAGFSVFIYAMQGGNLTEEYSVLFISTAIYFIVKYSVSAAEQVQHPPVYAFVYGICFTLLAFLRLNNAVTICAGVLPIILFLLYKKEYKNVLLNLLFGVLGIAVVAAPIGIYFHNHDALDEMIGAAFLHNFQIMGSQSHFSLMWYPIRYTTLYLPLIICILMLALHLYRTKKAEFVDVVFGSILFFNLINLWIANRFQHYFLVFMPVYILFLNRYFTIEKNNIIRIFVIICTVLHILFAGYFFGGRIYRYLEGSTTSRYETICSDMSKIPEDERDSVIGYMVRAEDYLHGDIIPCYKYYTLQEGWAQVNPEILTDFMNYLRSKNRPLWVFTNPDEDSQELADILSEHYSLQFKSEYLIFYRVK